MRIGFTGTVSVGKTTLVKELSKLDQFKNHYCVTERSKYLNELGIPLNTDSTLNGQIIFMAERAAELIRPDLITDRTIIDVMAFTDSAQSINYLEKDRLIEMGKTLIHQYDHIFYVSPEGVGIENNGVRETDKKYRILIDNKITKYLSDYSHLIKKCHYMPPNLSTEDRIKFIISTIL